MLLQKLEIKGFKSFGEKVTFNFDKGITAVVGPNGSGKSNVVDAIRWVLGEQRTRALRSEKMDNIIFNGTKKRKPLQLAEVSMTFKNTRNLLPTEYSEVTISRRYYRSGESEYLLNGITCRLKDINNLFLDTGIGPDSYAIIELKMVDEILNDTNNSRRTLFEEAAGISKFKKRKIETLKKLKQTDEDLERVEDLLHEIERNMRSLERQAKQAERFLKLKLEYKEKSLSLSVISVAEFIEKQQSVEEQLLSLQEQKVDSSTKIDALEAELQKLKVEIVYTEKDLSLKQQNLNKKVGEIRQLEGDQKVKQERFKLLSERLETVLVQINEDQESNEKYQDGLGLIEQEQAQLQKMLNEAEAILEEKRQVAADLKMEVEELEAVLRDLNQQHSRKQHESFQLNKSLEIALAQKDGLQLSIADQEEESEDTDSSIKNYDETIQNIEGQISALEDQYQLLQEQEQLQKAKSEKINHVVEQLKKELAQKETAIEVAKNELKMTQSMLDNMEGYPEALRFVRKELGWKNEFVPVLSEVIHCEDRYRKCMEGFLQPFLSHFISDDQKKAMMAIDLLREAGKGKVQVYLLEQFEKKAQLPQKLYEGCIPALEVVSFDDQYSGLFYYLLENVYITSSESYIPETVSNATFLVEDGSLIKFPTGLKGGGVGLFEGKTIGRAKQLDQLKEQITGLEEQGYALEQQIEDELKELRFYQNDTATAELFEVQQKIQTLRQQLAGIQAKREQFLEIIGQKTAKLVQLKKQLEQYEQTIDQSGPRLEELKNDLLYLQEEIEIKNEDNTRLSNKLHAANTEFNHANLEFHQLNNKLEAQEKELAYRKESLEKSAVRLLENQNLRKSLEEELSSLNKIETTDDTQIQDLYQMKEELGLLLSNVEKKFFSQRAEITELEESIKDFSKKKSHHEELVSEYKDQLSNLKMEMASVKERVKVEFDMALEEVIKNKADLPYLDTDPEELTEGIIAVRQKMDKMGAINHTAIEAYNEIKERYDFINAQKSDLVEAKESLLGTIDQIDQVATESFLKSFTEIRENFIEVFRSLFTEDDNCDLILVDPEDPLGSKIDIIARPKGKRPLTINQLSGGEKTLTATALLFAIYLLKPAPFCVFDEVDAPLDDANIDKFNRIIKKFSHTSQFIIVTHNKRTMSSTDIIYGVTMIEQGVTTVVPVDITELDENKII